MSATIADLRQQLAALEEDRAMLEWIRLNCRVVFYPPHPEYPIEHTIHCGKDQWQYLRASQNPKP